MNDTLCLNMERAVDVLRDASIWLRSLPHTDSKEKQDLFKKHDPPRKPEAVWSKTKEPAIVLETESFENIIKKKRKKKTEQDDEFDFTKAREKLREKFETVIAIPAEIKDKFKAKFLRGTAAQVDLLEKEESSSGREIDFDSEYDIIELHEHIFVIGGAMEGHGSEPTCTVEAFDCTTREWREVAPLPVQTTACYATTITGNVCAVVFVRKT